MRPFSTRLNRFDYFTGTFLYFVFAFLSITIIMMDATTTVDNFQSHPLFYVVYVVGFYLTFSLGVRRLHDIGHSGWWSLLFLIPILNFVVTIYLLFKKGDEVANKYGAPRTFRFNLVRIFLG